MIRTMDLQDALSLAKEHAERHSKSFVSFFGGGRSVIADDRDSYDHVVTGALIYLVLGVTLQDSFISGLKIDQISWLDRALGQIIFWITVGLLIYALVRILSGIADSRAFLIAFKVMPIAFLCGAYAASLGFFANYVLQLFETPVFNLPHLFHIIVQLLIIAAYMPRELRAYYGRGPGFAFFVTGIVFLFVLLVDFIVVFGGWFMPQS